MAFRKTAAEPMPPHDELTARMVGIGLQFASEPDVDADIESTIVFASISGMEQDSLRTLSVLTTWLGVHHPRINADRLVRLVGEQPSERVRAYWAAIARWLGKDRRFHRLLRRYDGLPIDLLIAGTAFQIARRGEDPRFAGSALRVPSGVLRDRADDVLSPDALVERHAGYRNRVLMGPSFRADVWTVLEKTPHLSVAEVARRAGCSFATAWQIVQDFRLLERSGARHHAQPASLSRAPREAAHVAEGEPPKHPRTCSPAAKVSAG